MGERGGRDGAGRGGPGRMERLARERKWPDFEFGLPVWGNVFTLEIYHCCFVTAVGGRDLGQFKRAHRCREGAVEKQER